MFTIIKPKIFFAFITVIAGGFLNRVGAQLKQPKTNDLVVIESKEHYLKSVSGQKEKHMVLLSSYLKPLFYDVRYATKNNFTSQVLYTDHHFLVREKAAIQLRKVQDSLRHLGLDLLFFDTYRPYDVTKKMWKIVPDERYTANPAKGSGHNRGIAIDLTLTDKKGNALEMPTGYDNFTDTAHHSFMQLPDHVLKNRSILKNTMEFFGFEAFSTEWWHYSLPNATDYEVLNFDFKSLKDLSQITNPSQKVN